MAAQTGAFASLVLPSTINCVWGEIEYVLHSADMVVADIAEISCVSAWVAFLTVVNSPYTNVSWRVLINIALITKVTIGTLVIFISRLLYESVFYESVYSYFNSDNT